MVYLRNKQVSKNALIQTRFILLMFCFLIELIFFIFYFYFLISYLMYSLSKKPVEEPNDGSADSVIAGIVEKILRESGIRGVVINCRSINVFRKKISLLHSTFKKFSRSGGKSISKLIDSWKAKNTLSKFSIISFKTIH